MASQNNIPLTLTDAEMEAIQALQEEMGLDSPSAVLQMLLRQAAQRVLVVCPTCGHSARKTAEDEAICASCLSTIHLVDGIWEVIR